MSGGPIGAGVGVGVAQHRAMYPSGSQPAGGPSASSQARSPRNGYAPPLPHQQQQQQQPSYQGHQGPPLHGQGPYAVPSMGPPPSSAMMNMQQELVYQVQFKRNCRAFTLRARAGFTVNERDFVVVEADRGEDIGIVVEIMTMHAFLERRMNAIRPSSQQGGGVEQEDQNVGCILRLATLHERQQLPDKFHAEKDIVQVSEIFPILVFQTFPNDKTPSLIYFAVVWRSGPAWLWSAHHCVRGGVPVRPPQANDLLRLHGAH